MNNWVHTENSILHMFYLILIACLVYTYNRVYFPLSKWL